MKVLSPELKKLAQELEDAGALHLGALYSWPRMNGNFIDVYGFGLMKTPHGIKFIAAHNSKKAGKMKFTMLEPELPLKMIAQGEVRYQGNILDPEWRSKHLDWEKTSLAICGFLSAFQTAKLSREFKTEDILNKIETGEMTLDELMQKAGIEQGLGAVQDGF